MSDSPDSSWSGEFELSVVSVGGRLGLYDCLRSMDDFVVGRPARLPALQDLLDQLGYADRERTELKAGLGQMWSIIPPIDLDALQDADFDPPGLIALANVVCLWGAQRFARLDADPDVPEHVEDLREVERIARWLDEQIRNSGRRSKRGGIARLADMQATIKRRRLDAAEARRKAEEADRVVQNGDLITARKSGSSEGLGSIWRRFSRPGAAVPEPPAADGIGPAEPASAAPLDDPARFAVDAVVPSLLPLHEHFGPLDAWAAGRPLPPRQLFLQGLYDTAGLPPTARRDWSAGRAALSALTPPLDATVVAEARLEYRASRALAVAAVVAARHALLRLEPKQRELPSVLPRLGEILSVLALSFEGKTDGLTARIDAVAGELSARGVATGGADRKRTEVQAGKDARRAHAAKEAEKARQAEAKEQERADRAVGAGSLEARQQRARRFRIVGGAVAVVLLAVAVGGLQMQAGGPPPAADYAEIPVVALVRGQFRVVARVEPAWPLLPAAERAPGAAELYARLNKEMGGELEELMIVDPRGKHLGGVKAGRVYWVEADAKAP